MRPISDLAFKNICEDFSCKCMDYCSEATYITMEEISHDCDPNTYDEEDTKNNFINRVLNIYELVMTKEGFEEYVGEYLKIAIDLRLNVQDWGDPEDINIGKNYDDFDKFVDDIDYEFLNKNLKRCWDRSCITDQPYPEDELFKFLDEDLIFSKSNT